MERIKIKGRDRRTGGSKSEKNHAAPYLSSGEYPCITTSNNMEETQQDSWTSVDSSSIDSGSILSSTGTSDDSSEPVSSSVFLEPRSIEAMLAKPSLLDRSAASITFA